MRCSEQLEQAYPKRSVRALGWNHTDHLLGFLVSLLQTVAGNFKILMLSQQGLRATAFLPLTASPYYQQQTPSQ